MRSNPRTMFEKIWDRHVVHAEKGKQTILYIDLQLVHEVTSPQAFEALRLAGRKVRRPERTVATVDHNVPTTSRALPITDEIAKQQIDTLRQNCKDFGIRFYDLDDRNQGIVHVIGPELGLTQPGMTIVCGDSHTATHGAFGALAFGIGTSEVEHVLATQTLLQHKPRTLEIRVEGRLPAGVTAKDLILWLIGQISTSGGTGYCIEYTGTAIRALSMEERMTVCNMTIEAGARSGLIAPDEKTFEYLRGRPFAPKDFDAAVEQWKKLPSDPGADYDRVERFHAADIEPQVTWGTNPGQVTGIGGEVPDPAGFNNPTDQKAAAAALEYMGLKPEDQDRRREDRLRFHRLLHERPHRRPADRRGRRPGIPRRRRRAGDGRARQPTGQAAGRGRRARQDLHGRRLRVARGRLQHVPGHESRQARTRPALRLDQQSQFRGTAGQGRADASGFRRRWPPPPP